MRPAPWLRSVFVAFSLLALATPAFAEREEGEWDDEDQGHRACKGGCQASLQLKVEDFAAKGAGAPAAPRVYLGRTALAAGAGNLYSIPLTNAAGAWLEDSFDREHLANNGVPRGSYIVVRLGEGRVLQLHYGRLPAGSSVYVKATSVVVGAAIKAVRNYAASPYEHQGNLIATPGNPKEDEFTVRGMQIIGRTTVTTDADGFLANYTCGGGVDKCKGVSCAALDACHSAGVCDAETGLCSSPPRPDGVACSDGNACTTGDTCQAGLCTPGTSVVCKASDACHVAGVCNPATGACSNPAGNEGAKCSDGNPCTLGDRCQAGACVGTPKVCNPVDGCHSAGECLLQDDPVDLTLKAGDCSSPPLHGALCNDGNPCTQLDVCEHGVCVGHEPVVCAPSSNACEGRGTCQHGDGVPADLEGQCSYPVNVGASCNDGDACTAVDLCNSYGSCIGTGAVSCPAPDACHAGVCDPASGCATVQSRGGCVIDGACIAAAAVNPANPCQLCQPSLNANGWSSAADGTTCSDGNGCTLADSCQAGACTAGNPACQNGGACSDAGGAYTCSCAAGYTGTRCDAACGAPPPCSVEVPVDTVHLIPAFEFFPATVYDTDFTRAFRDARGTVTTTPAGCTVRADGLPAGQVFSVWVDVDGSTRGLLATAGGWSEIGTFTADSCGHGEFACPGPLAPGQAIYINSGGGTMLISDNMNATSSAVSTSGFCAQFNDCARNTCQNGGACTDSLNGYSCACVPGFTGAHCETNVDDCAANPCRNGGTCIDGVSTYTCTCPAGYSGASCEKNVCDAITCAASDPCHTAGTCDTATGVCSNPAKADGTACDDGNACTQTDTCQSGTCTGANPVVCAAADQCHVAGSCEPSTGVCSNPPKSDGSACSDGNACTQTDTCQAGTCTGANPVVCAAADQCHVAGACEPSTGTCSNPAKADGAACNDGDACTSFDTCHSGVCTGSNPALENGPVAQPADDNTLALWTFDAGEGQAIADSSANGNAGWLGASASDGAADPRWVATDLGYLLRFCGAQQVTVPSSATLKPAHVAVDVDMRYTNPHFEYVVAKTYDREAGSYAIYDSAGLRFYVNLPGGWVASPAASSAVADGQWHHLRGTYDGSTVRFFVDGVEVGTGSRATGAILYNDQPLTIGAYAGAGYGAGTAGFSGDIDNVRVTDLGLCASVVCGGPSDQCHEAGTCDPTTGACSNPAKSDGSACDDGNACTQKDTCQAGACVGGNPITCTASDACHDAGTCDPLSGCSNPARLDGSSCSDGLACNGAETCTAGTCGPGTPPDCQHGGTCVEGGVNTYTCACPPGYEGNGVQCTDINACAGAPCFAGVQCTDVPAPGIGFSCGACPPGFDGDGVHCAPACVPSTLPIDLGTLGAVGSSAEGINAAGQIVGSTRVTSGSSPRAFLWTPDGTDGVAGNPQMKDLGTLGGISASATGLNAASQVVGSAYLSGDSAGHAFLWTPGGTDGVAGNPAMKDLGTLGGSNSNAWGINATGQVAGRAYASGDTAQRAFLWTPGGSDGVAGNPQMKDLGTLGGTHSGAQGINAAGQVVGFSSTSGDTAQRAFLWTPGGTDGVASNPQMKDLGTLGGTLGGAYSYAYGINDAGQVVGYSVTSGGGANHAFLWTPGGTDGVDGNPQMKDLGTLGGTNSFAYGLNDAGQIVGSTHLSADSAQRAFLWTPGGTDGLPGNPQMKDLGTLSGTQSFAKGLNATGQVVGGEYSGRGANARALRWGNGCRR